jgi:hypothetical protein
MSDNGAGGMAACSKSRNRAPDFLTSIGVVGAARWDKSVTIKQH